MGKTRVAIYPGTFDPITNGHLDILRRASDIFDRIVIVIAKNPLKQPLFSFEERAEMIAEAVTDMESIEIDVLDGLAVEGAAQHGAIALIRGLRAVSDFEFEFQMALMNRHLAPKLHTVYLMPKEEYTYLSSALIKNVARHGGDITRFVPSGVARRLYEKTGRTK